MRAGELPDDIVALIGVAQYAHAAELPVERGPVRGWCGVVENANPLFWDDSIADELTAGPIAPPAMLSVWTRPDHWSPSQPDDALPLQVHFDLKARFGFAEGIMRDYEMTFHEPIRFGDRITSVQRLVSVSDEKSTRLGVGRFWVIDVEHRNQQDELNGVETWTGFGYGADPAPARSDG